MNGRTWLLAFALAFPTVITYAHFVAVAPDEPTANPRLMALYTAGKLVQFALPVGFWWLTKRPGVAPPRTTSVADRETPRRRVGAVWLGVAFGLIVGTAILGLYGWWLAGSPAFVSAAQHVRAKVVEFGCDTPGRFVAFAAFLSLAHSLFEEYYWRWFAFGGLRATWPFWAAALLGSLAFAGHHVVVLSVYFPGAFWGAVLPFSLGVAAGGFVWCWMYERSGSLVGPWLSHVLIDAAIMAVGYHLVFGRS